MNSSKFYTVLRGGESDALSGVIERIYQMLDLYFDNLL